MLVGGEEEQGLHKALGTEVLLGKTSYCSGQGHGECMHGIKQTFRQRKQVDKGLKVGTVWGQREGVGPCIWRREVSMREKAGW